jgi:hypothetical protein
VGVGAQKAGTTWWFHLLEAHPAILPNARKELHFFANFWYKPFEPGDVPRYHSYFPRPEGTITGEWTPRYMSDFWTPSLLRRAAPEARILVLLRDPVERYVSGLTVSIGDALPPYYPDVAQDAMERGFYFEQLSRLLTYFERDQLLVLQYEKCARDVIQELERTYRFLGVDPAFVPPEAHTVVDPTEKKLLVPEETSEALVEFYEEDVRRLADAFPEIDISLWPSFAALTGPAARAR